MTATELIPQTIAQSYGSALNEAIQQAFAASVIEPLTAREREILSMISIGMSDRQIADSLIITLSTTKTHTRKIYAKLGLTRFNGNPRVLAAMYAMRHGMVGV